MRRKVIQNQLTALFANGATPTITEFLLNPDFANSIRNDLPEVRGFVLPDAGPERLNELLDLALNRNKCDSMENGLLLSARASELFSSPAREFHGRLREDGRIYQRILDFLNSPLLNDSMINAHFCSIAETVLGNSNEWLKGQPHLYRSIAKRMFSSPYNCLCSSLIIWSGEAFAIEFDGNYEEVMAWIIDHVDTRNEDAIFFACQLIRQVLNSQQCGDKFLKCVNLARAMLKLIRTLDTRKDTRPLLWDLTVSLAACLFESPSADVAKLIADYGYRFDKMTEKDVTAFKLFGRTGMKDVTPRVTADGTGVLSDSLVQMYVHTLKSLTQPELDDLMSSTALCSRLSQLYQSKERPSNGAILSIVSTLISPEFPLQLNIPKADLESWYQMTYKVLTMKKRSEEGRPRK